MPAATPAFSSTSVPPCHAAGEVAGLFPKDELDAIVNDIRPAMRAECPGARSAWAWPGAAWIVPRAL